MAIVAAALTGLAGGARPTANLSRPRRVATAIASGVFQLAAFFASMQPWANVR